MEEIDINENSNAHTILWYFHILCRLFNFETIVCTFFFWLNYLRIACEMNVTSLSTKNTQNHQFFSFIFIYLYIYFLIHTTLGVVCSFCTWHLLFYPLWVTHFWQAFQWFFQIQPDFIQRMEVLAWRKLNATSSSFQNTIDKFILSKFD